MRVVVLTNLYPPHGYGGYEWTCFDTMQRFREHGHQVSVLTSDWRLDNVTEAGEPDVERSLEAWWDWERQAQAQDGATRAVMRQEARNLARLRRVLDRAQPDVVSVWHMGGLTLSLLAEVERRRLPIVAVIEDDWLVYGPKWDPWRAVVSRHGLARLAGQLTGIPRRPASLAGASIVFASAHTRDRAMVADHWSFGQVAVEALGVDTRDFPPVVVPKARPWEWRLLYVGRMDPQKGVETLIRAFAQAPVEASLRILGGGNEEFRDQMADLVRELGVTDRVTFGVVPRGELAQAYRSADVVVFPSEWAEPFGLVPLEAMSCGVPVVATGTGGSGEFLADGENCVLFQPGNAEDLMMALTRLASDSALRHRLVTGGATTAGTLTGDRFSTRMLAVHAEQARRA